MTAAMPADDVCVVVPAYDEGRVLADVIAALRARFDLVVCVDDGSTDDTAPRAAAAGAVVVRHRVNLGQGAALQTGFDYALRRTSARHVVTFDADGQHDPDDALKMVGTARRQGVDVVLGSRFLGPGAAEGDGDTLPRGRRTLLRAATRFTRVTTGLAVTDSHNGLRVLGRDAVARLRIELRGMAHASELLRQVADLGLTYVEAPVSIRYTDYSRAKGQPGLNAVNVLVDLALHRVCAAR